jgi:hypothetical protein
MKRRPYKKILFVLLAAREHGEGHLQVIIAIEYEGGGHELTPVMIGK